MNKTALLILISLMQFTSELLGCGVTPSFSYTSSHNCGIPRFLSINNNSTGNNLNNTQFWWKLDIKMVSDTINGKSNFNLSVNTPGVHVLKLFIKDSSNCIDSTTSTMNIQTGAKAIIDQNFQSTYVPIWMNCLQFISDPDTFRIQVRSADTINSLKIIWGDGSMDSSNSPLYPNSFRSHLYNNLGVFNVKIISSNGSCIDTVNGMVYNQRQPTAGIIGPASGSNRGCAPHTLRIVNNSYNISDNTNFRIEWGNGEYEDLPYTAYKDTIFHTYVKGKGVCAGIIKITATNVCGSSFTTWNPIDISDKDKAKWTVTPTCIPTGDYVFQNLSIDKYCLMPDIKEYYWDFGDSTNTGWIYSKAAQSHNYKKEGDYTVTLIAKTACGNDTFKNQVSVYYNPVSSFSATSYRSCLPLTTTLVDTSFGRGHSRLWTVNEGGVVNTYTDSILNYTFTKAGNHSISLKVTNQCNSSTLSKTFVITDKPKANFGNIASSCVPMKVTFNNTSFSYFTNASYTWDFGDNSNSTSKNPPQKTYTIPGNYTVKLIVKDSCGSDTISKSFVAYGLPNAQFTTDTSICTFDSLKLYNSSTNASSYSWNFGTGSNYTQNDTGLFKFVYINPGVFNIRLIVSAGSGCKDTAFQSINIRPGAKASFTADKKYACNPATFKFTNNSIYAQNFAWYANNTLIATSKQIADSTLYNDSSIVVLKLVTSSNNGCRADSMSLKYFTPKNPKAIIANLDSGCGPLKVNFVNQSTFTYSSLWKPGNSLSTSTLKNPSFTYQSARSRDTFYYPQLKVKNWAGCSDSVSSVVKVFPQPNAKFTSDQYSGCGPLTVQFTNQSKTNNQEPYSSLKHFWKFNNGQFSIAPDTSSSFVPSNTKDSIYKVILKVQSINSCTHSDTQNIRVYPIPLVKFSSDTNASCSIFNANFKNNSSPKDTGSIRIMNFNWSSGNGFSSSNQNFSATYSDSKFGDTIYLPKLIARSEHNCVDSFVLPITVHPQPKAIFNTLVQQNCTPVKIKINNQSVSSDKGPLKHDWDFGNNYLSTKAVDSTLYNNKSASDITYYIKYIAISQYNCKDTAYDSVLVHPKPMVNFGKSTQRSCSPALVKLSDSSNNAFIQKWFESSNVFVGNSIDSLRLKGLYLKDTTYYIGHSVESIHGCYSDTIYQSVTVLGKPKADFEFSNDSTCAHETISLINNSLGAYQYQWNFGDNSSSTTINPKHKYFAQNGNDTFYNTQLIVNSVYDCKDTVSKSLFLVQGTNETFFTDKSSGCTQLTVQFINESKRFKTHSWDFGDQSTKVFQDSVSHTYINATGSSVLSPKITLIRNRFQCFDTTTKTIDVNPKPTANFRALRLDPCNDGTYQMSNTSQYGTKVNWYKDGIFIQNSNTFNHILTPSVYKDTFYEIQIISSNNYSCSDSTKQVIKVKPKLKVDFKKVGAQSCENTAFQFTNTSFNSMRYFWRFGDGGISNDVHPIHIYSQYGTFYIKLFGYDKDGCVDSTNGTDFFKVIERPKANFYFTPEFPKLPNAKVDFFSTSSIQSANVNSLNYDWNFGDNSYPTNNSNQQNPNHDYLAAGTYSIQLKVGYLNCFDSISKTLVVDYAKPEISFEADTLEGCAPLRVKFNTTSSNVTSFRWLFNDGTSESFDAEPIHVFDLPGEWDVSVIATGPGGSVTLTKKLLIKTYPKPFLDFYSNERNKFLPNAVFNVINNSGTILNQWDIIDSSSNTMLSSKERDPSFTLNTVGSFDIRLIGTSTQGCIDTLIKTRYFSTLGQGSIYVPNAFSPDNNQRNEIFKPVFYNVMDRNYIFRIYNRWGEKVFETSDIQSAWDGKLNGVLCEQDVYIWTINGEYYNNDLFSFRGTVTLLR
jgi:gliding motility-associated-like protein